MYLIIRLFDFFYTVALLTPRFRNIPELKLRFRLTVKENVNIVSICGYKFLYHKAYSNQLLCYVEICTHCVPPKASARPHFFAGVIRVVT